MDNWSAGWSQKTPEADDLVLAMNGPEIWCPEDAETTTAHWSETAKKWVFHDSKKRIS